MNEKTEWMAFIDNAPTVELKVTRARTTLAQLRSDSDNGGPSHADEIAEVRKIIKGLKK